MKPASLSVSRILLGLAAIVGVHLLLSWPPAGLASARQVQPETWLLLGLAGFIALRRGRPSAFYSALAAFWCVVLVAFRSADFVFARYFGRPLELKLDFWMWYNLTDLVQDTYGLAGAIGIYLALVLVLVLLVALLAFFFTQAGAVLGRRAALIPWVVAGGLAAYFLPSRSPHDPDARSVLSVRFTQDLIALLQFRFQMDEFDALVVEEIQERAATPQDLEFLGGKDVYILFVESYGRCAWDAPAYREVLAPRFRDFEERLEESGYTVASRFVASSAFGGGSWLAHATLLTGVWIDNNVYWERILTSGVPPLSGYFRRKGYETVSVMPAMHIESWPEGAYYEFTRDLWQKDLAYDHHGYDWSPMPDQFVLYRFDEKVLRETRAPVFAELILTSSHAPFSAIPPFHDGAWNYEDLMWTLRNRPMGLFKENTYQSLPRGVEGYTTAIDYSLRSIVDFLVEHLERDAVVLILGDHQPMGIMPGTETNQVPLHLISPDPALTERFQTEADFAAGWFPREDQEILFLNEVTPLFLRLSSTAEK